MAPSSPAPGPLLRDLGERAGALAERYAIVECTFDPWRAGEIGQELE